MARKPGEGFGDEKLCRGIPAQEIGQQLLAEDAAIRIVRVIVKDCGAICIKDTASRKLATKHAKYVVLCRAQPSKRQMARMPPVATRPARTLAPSVTGEALVHTCPYGRLELAKIDMTSQGQQSSQ